MSSSIPQSSFTGGELSPSIQGRVDLARYYTGLNKCQNFIVRHYGGVSNRPGTRFVADLTESCRLIPFQFSTTQTYVLAFGNLTMRIFKDGGQVLYPGGHAQAGQPVVITTLYPVEALPRIKYIQDADVMTICHPDYPPQQLSRTDHHAWTFAAFANISGPFQDINVTEANTVYVSAPTGNVTVTSSGDIFSNSCVGKLFYIEQSPDSLTNKWEVNKAIVVNDIRRAGSNYYQATSAGTTGTVKPDHTEGSEYDGSPGVSWKYMHSGNGIILITGYTTAKVVTGTVINRIPNSLITSAAPKNISTVTPSPDGVIKVKVNVVAHGFANNSSVTISGVVGTNCNGTWQIEVIDANWFYLQGVTDTTAYVSGGTAINTLVAVPSYRWAFEAWGGDEGYPSTATYFQQRQAFGASPHNPQTVWMSRTKGYTDFGVSTPILDDDALNFTVASREVNEIRHMIELSELIVLTSDGQWVMKGTQDGTITPSSVNVKRQGSIGSSHIPPLVVDSNVVFVTDKNAQLRNLGYSFQQDSFIGNDLTLLANHLFVGHSIVSIAYQRLPFSCIWAVRDDGVLLGCTYMPEQDVIGWHRHTTEGAFKDVCVITEGNEDAAYFAIDRTIGGVTKHYIERLTKRDFAGGIEYGVFLDSSLSYIGDTPTSTLSGLNHLEGETVGIMADGAIYPPQVVAGGTITLTEPAMIVHAGLPITSEIETLPISVTGSPIRERQKLINKVSLIVEESSGIWAGADEYHLYEYKQRTNEPYGDPPSTCSGLIDISVSAAWNKQGQLLIRQADPLPISILAVVPEVSTGGV